MSNRLFASAVIASLIFTAGAFADVGGKAVVRVVTNGATITISMSEAGPLYSVKSPSGESLATNLSEMEMKEKNRELYDMIKPAVATSAFQRYTIDARMGY